MRSSGMSAGVVMWPRQHADLLGIGFLTLLALGMRAQIVFRAPVFMAPDSLGYFLPAYDLVTGQGFDVGFRRTPVYPLFIAACLKLFGEDLSAIVATQHLLGAATAALTYLIGRVTVGRLVGLVAGALVALDGALLVGEHYLMTEGVFIPLLALTLLTLILAVSRSRAEQGTAGNTGRPRASLLVGAGLLMGLTALCRPVAQPLIVLAPLALLLGGWGWRSTIVGSVAFGAGFVALLAPWAVYNAASHGDASTTGVIGQAMLARTAYYDRGFVFYDERQPERGQDAPRAAARRIVENAKRDRLQGGAIARRLQSELDLSDPELARLNRELALDVILRQPAYYLQGTAAMTWQLFQAEYDRVGYDWKTQGRRVSRDEWPDRAAHLLANPTDAQNEERGRVEAATNIWQPAFWAPWLPLASFLGLTLAFVVGGPARLLLLPGLATFILLLTSAAINGPLPRDHYPTDPYMALAAVSAVVLAYRLIARRRQAASETQPRAAPESADAATSGSQPSSATSHLGQSLG
ncbi:MAG: glycosyltransferase family 39 protein [Chloroflexi bacterium]|nr:glycosyltransferase family 39 protein [Chloroflexota bacterium]